MTKHFLMYCALALITSLTQCSKTAVSPELPPETQTGTSTFACKINGVVWKYKDPDYQFLDTRPKTRWIFDPNDTKGVLRISGLTYSTDGSVKNNLIIGADSLTLRNERTTFGNPSAFGVTYFNYDDLTKCQITKSITYDTSKNFFSNGKLTLTKFDPANKIIAGTFYCTIKQTGCDTLKITDGRFDLKYQ